MRIFAPLFIFLFCSPVFAEGGFGKGVTFDLGLGYGSAVIENPDQTKANYKVLALSGRALLPLVEGDDFTAHLTGGVRYLDLENTANGGPQSEVANSIGPGAGLRLRAFKFFVAYEYYFMLSRHYAIGNISRSSKYQMPVGNLSGGFTIPLKQLSVSFSYSQSAGTVPKASSELSKDSPYNDQIYWLQVSYSTGSSLAQFFGFLF